MPAYLELCGYFFIHSVEAQLGQVVGEHLYCRHVCGFVALMGNFCPHRVTRYPLVHTMDDNLLVTFNLLSKKHSFSPLLGGHTKLASLDNNNVHHVSRVRSRKLSRYLAFPAVLQMLFSHFSHFRSKENELLNNLKKF